MLVGKWESRKLLTICPIPAPEMGQSFLNSLYPSPFFCTVFSAWCLNGSKMKSQPSMYYHLDECSSRTCKCKTAPVRSYASCLHGSYQQRVPLDGNANTASLFASEPPGSNREAVISPARLISICLKSLPLSFFRQGNGSIVNVAVSHKDL